MSSQKHTTSLDTNRKRFQRSLEKDLHSKYKLFVSISHSLRVVRYRNIGLLSSPWEGGHYRKHTYKTEHWTLVFWNKHFSLKSKLHKIKQKNMKCLVPSAVLVGFPTFRGYWYKYLQKEASIETLRTSLQVTKFNNKRCFHMASSSKALSQL